MKGKMIENNIDAVLAGFEASGGITKKNASLIAPIILEYVLAVEQMPFVHGVSVGYGVRMMEKTADGIEVYTSADLKGLPEEHINLLDLIGNLAMSLGDFGIQGLTPFGECDTQMKQHPGHIVVYTKNSVVANQTS